MSVDHLALLLREGRSLTIETPGGVELEACLDALDLPRSRITFRLANPSPPVSPGDALKVAFTYEGQRWVAPSHLHHYPDRSTYVASLPRSFEAAERRSHPRWEPLRHVGRVEVRTRLGEGLVLSGPLVSLSEGGLSFLVEDLKGPGGEVA